jgi:hypothetical protein
VTVFFNDKTDEKDGVNKGELMLCLFFSTGNSSAYQLKKIILALGFSLKKNKFNV